MSINQKVVERLRELRLKKAPVSTLISQHVTPQLPYIIEEEDKGIVVKSILQDVDTYGCLVKEFEITITPGVNQEQSALIEKLRNQIKQIEERMTYLFEKFTLVEFDKWNLKAQLRTSPPERVNGALCYFEIILEGGYRLFLTRFQKPIGQHHRIKIPYNLSLEAVERLIRDLIKIIKTE